MTLGLKVPMQNNRIPNGLGMGWEEKNSILKEVGLQINMAIQCRSSSNTNEGRGGRTLLTYRRGENSRGNCKRVTHEGRLSGG